MEHFHQWYLQVGVGFLSDTMWYKELLEMLLGEAERASTCVGKIWEDF